MKKFLLLFVVAAIAFAACAGPQVNPNVGPELTVIIPEDEFGPNPDNPSVSMAVSIQVKHPVDIKDWSITIQPARIGQGQRPADAPARPEGAEPRQPRGPFFEQKGTGRPPAQWNWNGRSTRGDGSELVQSATDYRFILIVNDIFDNTSNFEGIITTDVIVREEGGRLRIVVPSIIFPADSADLTRVAEDDRRANERVLRLIARSLNRYEDYRITIEGHANPTTPADAARLRTLSEQRATSVRNYLVSTHNITATRFRVLGLGTTRTVADHLDDEENWKNRRVEFLLER